MHWLRGQDESERTTKVLETVGKSRSAPSSWVEWPRTLAAVMLGLTLALVSPVSAQPYRYVDDQGVTHWVQSPHQIPDMYRALTSIDTLSVAVRAPSSTPRTFSPALTPVPEPELTRPDPIEDEAVRRWKGKLLLEIQRLRAEVARCENAGRGRSACREAQQRELFVLEAVLSRGTAPLAGTEGSLKQRYEHDTRLLLGGLQHVAARLRNKESISYEPFLRQMNAFKRDLEAFRSRYHSLITTSENGPFIGALLKASDLLISSAETWTREMHSKGSVEARETAKRERATQWDTARRFIEEALVNPPRSDG